MGASRVLGTIGICISWFSIALAEISPLPTLVCMAGLALGIIGLSVKKEKGKEKRDVMLNIISIIEAIILFLLWVAWSSWVANL